jgi:hypothetical protein
MFSVRKQIFSAALQRLPPTGSSMLWVLATNCCLAASLSGASFGTDDDEQTLEPKPTRRGFFAEKRWALNVLPPPISDPMYSFCETIDQDTISSSSFPAFRPLDGDIDAVVDEILRDPSINLLLIPDSIERRLYKSTIQLTLSLVYDTIASIHGTEILSHEIHLRRLPEDPTRPPLYKDRTKINDHVLEEVAERLLSNQAINSSLLPDNIEKQLYVNCIKVIFRTLDAVFDGFTLQVCGHEFRISLQAAQMERAAVKASHSIVDLDLLRQYARDHGVQEDQQQLSFWDSLFLRKEFTAQLHAAMYGLVLGIIDDILANTKIQILGDTMELDIVPMQQQKLQKKTAAENSTRASTTESPSSLSVVHQQQRRSQALGLPIFAAGVGVGAAIVTIATLVTGSGGAR